MRPQTKGLKPEVIQIDRDEKGASTAVSMIRSASILGGGLASGGGEGSHAPSNRRPVSLYECPKATSSSAETTAFTPPPDLPCRRRAPRSVARRPATVAAWWRCAFQGVLFRQNACPN